MASPATTNGDEATAVMSDCRRATADATAGDQAIEKCARPHSALSVSVKRPEGATLTPSLGSLLCHQKNRGPGAAGMRLQLSLLAALVSVATAAFASRSELLVARDAWCDNPTTAASTYGPIGQWDVSEVTDLSTIFCATTETGCNPACASFNDDISGWDTSRVTTLRYAFFNAAAFNRALPWDTSNVTSLYGTFAYAGVFDQPLAWDTAHVTSLYATFYGATAFNQPLLWNTSNVVTLSTTFRSASSFNQVLQWWDTARVTNLGVRCWPLHRCVPDVTPVPPI